MVYLGLALAPILVILIYIYVRDKFNKEPFWLLFLSLLGGMFSVIPVIIAGIFINKFLPPFIDSENPFFLAFFQAGFIEELFKYLVVVLLVWKSKHFDEEFDGIIYAVYVSMGFALVENILYVFGSEHSLIIGLTRAVTAVPAHAIFAIAMGYYLGLAKFKPQKLKLYFILAFVVAWLMHGVYDYIIMSKVPILLSVFIIYLIWMYFYGFKKIKELAKLKIAPSTIKVEDVTNDDENNNLQNNTDVE